MVGMIDFGSRKLIAGVQACFCFIPSAFIGVASDLFWWEWLIVVPIAALFLGLPQLAMLFVSLFCKDQLTRVWSLVISGIALAVFFVLQTDIHPTSSSTASLSYFFLQLKILPFSVAAIAVVAWLSPADS